MTIAMDYVFSTEWLPYVTGKTLGEAMQALEDRLASLPQDQLKRGSQWAYLVYKAIDDLVDSTCKRSWYSENVPKPLGELPATFELAVESRLAASNPATKELEMLAVSIQEREWSMAKEEFWSLVK